MPPISAESASPDRDRDRDRAAGPDTGRAARPTLAIIAAEAGVSLPTVSKVVNGRPDVAADTRARVEQLLAVHHYPRAGTGRQRRSGLIDLVFNGLDSPWAVEILRGVEDWGASHETGVAVSSVRHGNTRPASWTSALASHDTDGVILVISKPTQAQLEQLRSRARIDGYRSALERAGIAFDRTLVRHGDFQHEGGFAGGGELLDLADRPTAIFAGNDQHALGVYEAARQRSLRIPQDLSVVGFDDLPVARWVSPPLTTIRQPLAEMGRTAAQMLGELIEGRPLHSTRVELSTELITRESTGSLEAAP